MVKMTVGKFRGIQAVADSRGTIRAAAMDQRGSLRKSIAKERGVKPEEVTTKEMEEFKTLVSRVLTPHATAILLDPEFGLDAARVRPLPGRGVPVTRRRPRGACRRRPPAGHSRPAVVLTRRWG